MSFNNPHAKSDEENREWDRLTAASLRKNPGLIAVAQENLRRWLSAEHQPQHPALIEWQAILHFLTPHEVADFLESRSPKAERLRQSSPFVGREFNQEADVLAS